MKGILAISKGKLNKNIKFNIISYTNKKHLITLEFKNNIKSLEKKEDKIGSLEYSNLNLNNIKIFDEYFVENNKQKIILIIENKKNKLKSMIIESSRFKIKIKIKILEDLVKLERMFCNCSYLISISNLPFGKRKKIINIHRMFAGCKALIKL